MSDYALMRKMHEALKQARNEIEWLLEDISDETLKEKLEQINWNMETVIREANQ